MTMWHQSKDSGNVALTSEQTLWHYCTYPRTDTVTDAETPLTLIRFSRVYIAAVPIKPTP